MKRASTAGAIASLFAVSMTPFTASARSITGITFSRTDFENILAEISLAAGAAGDDHVAYVSWDSEDRGASLAAWPATNIVRVGNIAPDATSVVAVLPKAAEKGRAFRAFLATPKRTGNFDSLISCIRSSGGAYIDTGFCLTTNSEVFFDFQVPEYSALRMVVAYDLFGAMPMGTALSYRVYFLKNDWRWYYACGKDATSETLKITFGGTTTLADSTRTAITLSPRTWTWRFQRESDGKDLSGSLARSFGQDPSTLSLSLFATHTSSGFARVATNGVIYAASIRENDVYVRKMQPAVRNGVAGLWDAVNDTFYPSAGSRDFHATETNGVAFATVSFDDVFTDMVIPGETQVAASDAFSFSNRRVTGLSFRQKSGQDAVATVTLTQGPAGDVDVLYLAWGDADCGTDMDDWPNAMRVCALSSAETEHSFSVTNEMDGATFFRAFLATAWHPGADRAVECIRSAGTAYADTGFCCGLETKIAVDVQFPDIEVATDGMIYGMSPTGTLYGVCFQKINGYDRFDYRLNKAGTTTWIGYLNCWEYLRQRATMASKGKSFSIDFPGKRFSTTFSQAIQGVDRANLPLFLFARSTYDGDGYTAADVMPFGLLFGATIQEDDEYKRYFYPGVKAGVAGLCDFVTGTFLPSSGTGAFLASDADGVDYAEVAFPSETVYTTSPAEKGRVARGLRIMIK